jgi:HEPN domain-containing protein
MGGRHNGAMNRSADGLHQAQADLELAGVSAAAGHHEWACFACHQAVEKALKGLHLAHGQQAWGHGLGRSWRDLPPAVAVALAASVSDLEDRLRILDALYIPTRNPDSLAGSNFRDGYNTTTTGFALPFSANSAHIIFDAYTTGASIAVPSSDGSSPSPHGRWGPANATFIPEQVPGPLPVLGVFTSFRVSRKLRKRLRTKA